MLKAQITILRARIPTDRIILSPAEKAELIRIGEECGHEIDGLMEVAIHPSPEKGKKKPALPWATFIHALIPNRGGRNEADFPGHP